MLPGRLIGPARDAHTSGYRHAAVERTAASSQGRERAAGLALPISRHAKPAGTPMSSASARECIGVTTIIEGETEAPASAGDIREEIARGRERNRLRPHAI